MAKDLTNSKIDRQNILNNGLALETLKSDLSLPGFSWEGDLWFTKQQVADVFGVDLRTIERYLELHEEELKQSGYTILRGKKLQEIKLTFGTDINVGTKTSTLGILSFRATLNLAMLLSESETAKHIRQRVLDIVMDILMKKTGGHTKYINQRDSDYLTSAFQEKSYRKEFTSALNDCVEMGNYKYGYFTDLIYKNIFHENANEYRNILRLTEKEKVRETMYAEILQLIASMENGFASELRRKSERLQRKLRKDEVDELFAAFANHPAYDPLKENARARMASRDLCFRDALHHKLQAYISAVPRADFDKFIGETSKSLEERLKETTDVFLRLRDR